MRWNPNPEGGNDERDSYEHKDLLKSYDKSTYAWQPEMEDKIIRITKSSVGTFDFCPKQYYFQNILGLRGEERDYHIRGSNVHDAVEWFWKESRNIMDEVLSSLKNGDRETARSILLTALPTPPEPYIYGEAEQLIQYVDWQFMRLVAVSERWIDDYPTVKTIEDWFPVGNEEEIHASREVVASDGTEVTIHMKGFIDRMFIDDDHIGIILMELKTGKWIKRKASQMRAEMQFYRMMLEHSPHMEYLPIVGWGWQFPGGGINGGDGPHWDFESVNGPGGRYAPKTVEKRLVRIVDAHLNDDFPPEPHERKCEYCDFMEMCPAWMGEYALDGGKEIDPQ